MNSKDRVLRNVCVSKLREAVGLRVNSPQPAILAHTAQMKTVSKKYFLKVLLLLVKTYHLHIFFSRWGRKYQCITNIKPLATANLAQARYRARYN